jgi:hypothetical protein
MTRQEFLEGLKRALLSTGSPNLIEENMSFYSSYIDGEIAKGRSLEEVMEELGDPRLIANSIKVAEGYDEEFSGNVMESEEREYENTSFNRDKEDSGSTDFKSFSLTGNSARVALIGIIIVLVLVVILLVALVAGVLSLLAPVLIPLIVLGIIFQIFTRSFRR